MNLPERTKFQVVTMMLRPVLRYCLRNCISLYELVEIIKTALVDLADEEIRASRERSTVSRISVMTGVHRPDVARIFNEEKRFQMPASIVRRVIGQWEQDVRFQTKSGKPRVLTYKGEHSEFAQLVFSVSKDVSHGAVLAELKRSGAVKLAKGGVKLSHELEYHDTDADKGMIALARDAEILVSAVEENLYQQPEIRNLHLVTEYDNIFASDIPSVKKWLLEQGTEFHKRMREYLAQHDKDLNPQRDTQAGRRVAIGTFSFATEEKEV